MPSLWTTALMLFALFFAYYVYEPPYRGLYPDVLPDSVFGRAQGVQHVFRGIALAGALIGGGFLFHLWRPAPFLVAAFVVSVACAVPILLVTEDGGHGRVFEGVRSYVARSWRVLRSNRDVATFLVANTAWEGTFAGARTFVVLYVTVGLGEPLVTSTYILGAVAAGYIVAALVAGRIGDRIGLARVIAFASAVYGVGLLAGGFGREWHAWYLALIFVVAIAGGTVMTLAWGLLFKLMPAGGARGDRGACDDDQGRRARDRPARRGRRDRHPRAAPRGHGGIPGCSGPCSACRSSSRSRSSRASLVRKPPRMPRRRRGTESHERDATRPRPRARRAAGRAPPTGRGVRRAGGRGGDRRHPLE